MYFVQNAPVKNEAGVKAFETQAPGVLNFFSLIYTNIFTIIRLYDKNYKENHNSCTCDLEKKEEKCNSKYMYIIILLHHCFASKIHGTVTKCYHYIVHALSMLKFNWKCNHLAP